MTEAQQEAYNERAGIMEYDSGLSREYAEKIAAIYVDIGREEIKSIIDMEGL